MKKMNYKTKVSLGILSIVLLTCAVAVAASPISIIGSGNIVKTDRDVENFKGIKVGSAIEVFLKHGDSQKVTVESDDNIIDYIVTEVNDKGILVIKMKNKTKVKNATKMNVYVTYTTIESIGASGASTVNTEGSIKSEKLELTASGATDINCKLEVSKLTLDVSGASEINIKGETKELDAEVSGASSLIANDLDAETVKIDVSGASGAKVKATKSIDADASGASSLKYSGHPANKTLNKSGASSIYTL